MFKYKVVTAHSFELPQGVVAGKPYAYSSDAEEMHNVIDWLRCPDGVGARVLDSEQCKRVIDLLIRHFSM